MIDTDNRPPAGRPARLVWRIGALLVASYLVVAVVGIGFAIDDRTVTYGGSLDARELRASNSPDPAALDRAERTGAFLSDADGTMTKPDASAGLIAAWSVLGLAGPLVALLVFGLVSAPLRAAGRGDPFAVDAAARLQRAGVVLLVAYPVLQLAGWVVGEWASSGPSTSPVVGPGATVQFLGFLPGMLVLALATVFRAGTDLHRFEQDTI